ncbi:MAG: class I SAM-dependent methyltransferase [Nocardioides sp.]|nr:class I SAM-dependent methyltransferase [Nocardioides sp.]
MHPADFYTGIVVDAYARLKSTSFDPDRYAAFVVAYGEPALELGCGDGEPMLSLLAQGLDVEGVDSSRDMLDRFASVAAAAGLAVTLHHQRVEHLRLDRGFRSIYLAGPTFNLLADDDTALSALTAIRAHLTEDGRALIPLWIPEPTPPEHLQVARETFDDDGALLRYLPVAETYDREGRTRVTRVRYERVTAHATEVVEREWTLHWHTQDGFNDLCEQAELRVESIQDDDGQPADDQADYVIATVRR